MELPPFFSGGKSPWISGKLLKRFVKCCRPPRSSFRQAFEYPGVDIAKILARFLRNDDRKLSHPSGVPSVSESRGGTRPAASPVPLPRRLAHGGCPRRRSDRPRSRCC